MKRFLILLVSISSLLCVSNAMAWYHGNSGGVGFIYSLDENIGTLKFDSVDYGYHVGLFMNLSEEDERSFDRYDHGQVLNGDETRVFGFDIGYSYPIHDFIRLGIEGSVALVREYDKYRYSRYTDNYYLVKTNEEMRYGIGGSVMLPMAETFEVIVNYNTLKGIGIGFSFRF